MGERKECSTHWVGGSVGECGLVMASDSGVYVIQELRLEGKAIGEGVEDREGGDKGVT